LGAMGVVGLTAPESAGGLGMDEVDLVLLLEESGRAASPEPLAEHTAVVMPTLADVAPEHHLLGAAATGECTLSVGLSHSPYVSAAHQSDALLLQHETELHLVEIDGYRSEPVTSVDESRRLARVSWTPGAGTLLTDDPDHVARAFDRGALAAAAQCLGVAQQLLDLTVEYVQDRKQFGKPVGVNQAVKHHLANVGLALEFARPVTYQAAWAVANDRPERSRDVSMAKAMASDAVDVACRQALQCHGAIGYTVEYDLQLWLKRGWALAADWGDAAWHRRQVADVVLGPIA
ncbi:MAG: acyl-CoA dehydrogenase family protein, partial [Acidimicrobiales bacterium]